MPSDRPLVAAVIYNRLRAGIPLGIDATLRYALHDFTQPLTESELALDRRTTRASTTGCRRPRSPTRAWRR